MEGESGFSQLLCLQDAHPGSLLHFLGVFWFWGLFFTRGRVVTEQN